MKEKVAERLKKFRKRFGLSVADLAKILEKGNTAIYAIEQGRVFLQMDDLAVLHAKFRLNNNWMISGTGEMLVGNPDDDYDNLDLKGLIRKLKSEKADTSLLDEVYRRVNNLEDAERRLNEIQKLVSHYRPG